MDKFVLGYESFQRGEDVCYFGDFNSEEKASEFLNVRDWHPTRKVHSKRYWTKENYLGQWSIQRTSRIEGRKVNPLSEIPPEALFPEITFLRKTVDSIDEAIAENEKQKEGIERDIKALLAKKAAIEQELTGVLAEASAKDTVAV